MTKKLLFSEIPHHRDNYKTKMKEMIFAQRIYRGSVIFALVLATFFSYINANLKSQSYLTYILIGIFSVAILEIIWYHYFNYMVGHIIDIFDEGVVTRYKTKKKFYPKDNVEKIKIDGKEEKITIDLKDKNEQVIIRKSASKIKGKYLDKLYELEDATDKLDIELEIIYP